MIGSSAKFFLAMDYICDKGVVRFLLKKILREISSIKFYLESVNGIKNKL